MSSSCSCTSASRPLLNLLTCWWLSSSSLFVWAQEPPFLDNVSKFDVFTTPYRTNVCERQHALTEGKIMLRDALRDLDLTVAITNHAGKGGNEEHYFSLSDDGTIKTDDPGLYVTFLDEVSKRAGFRWRDTYVAVSPLTAAEDGNRTWTDLLLWEVQNFDIAVDYFAKSTRRLGLGVAFPHGWYNGDIVMARLDRSVDASKMNLWNFLAPFTPAVWFAVVLAIIFTGSTYYLLERVNSQADDLKLEDKPLSSIFLAALAATGHFEYMPETNPARLLGVSWMFWTLIVVSAYTANMGAFLLSTNTVDLPPSSIEEAAARGVPVCVQRGAVVDETLSDQYPQLSLVRKDSAADMFPALHLPWYNGAGGCGLLLANLATFHLYQSNVAFNRHCDLVSEKKVVLSIPNGFATAVDAGVMCTSLVNYVLDVHFQEMRADGTIDRLWQEYYNRMATISCPHDTPQDMGTDLDTIALTPAEMGGIFVVHGMLSFLALVFALLRYFRRKYYPASNALAQQRSNLFPTNPRNIDGSASSSAPAPASPGERVDEHHRIDDKSMEDFRISVAAESSLENSMAKSALHQRSMAETLVEGIMADALQSMAVTTNTTGTAESVDDDDSKPAPLSPQDLTHSPLFENAEARENNATTTPTSRLEL